MLYIYIYIYTFVIYIYIYIYIFVCIYIYIYIYTKYRRLPAVHLGRGEGGRLPDRGALLYTRSPLEDSRLFGPSPWRILRHYL